MLDGSKRDGGNSPGNSAPAYSRIGGNDDANNSNAAVHAASSIVAAAPSTPTAAAAPPSRSAAPDAAAAADRRRRKDLVRRYLPGPLRHGFDEARERRLPVPVVSEDGIFRDDDNNDRYDNDDDDNDNDNVLVDGTALAVDIFARATVMMNAILLGPALLKLAAEYCQEQKNRGSNNGAGGIVDDDDDKNCRVYGLFRPSSLLTNIASVSGICVCFVLPVFGAVVDRTPYRRQVGAYTAVCPSYEGRLRST